MALTWFFGKKKEDKPIPVTVEGVEEVNDGDFTVLKTSTGQAGIYPQVPPSPYPTSQFYTTLPYSVTPHQNQHSTGNTVRSGVQNQLEGVPFILSPSLDQGRKNNLAGLEDLRRGVFQIAADINDKMFEYDFKLENNILQEASIYSGSS